MAKKKSQPIYQLTPEKTLNALLRLGRRNQDKIDGLAGELGSAVANAVEHNHLHRKAFSFIRQCDKMPPEKLAEFKAHFDDYYVKSGLLEREDSVERLDMGDAKANGKGHVEGEDEEETATAH